MDEGVENTVWEDVKEGLRGMQGTQEERKSRELLLNLSPNPAVEECILLGEFDGLTASEGEKRGKELVVSQDGREREG